MSTGIDNPNHSTTPCSIALKPTANKTSLDKLAPIKNNVKVSPIFEIETT